MDLTYMDIGANKKFHAHPRKGMGGASYATPVESQHQIGAGIGFTKVRIADAETAVQRTQRAVLVWIELFR